MMGTRRIRPDDSESTWEEHARKGVKHHNTVTFSGSRAIHSMVLYFFHPSGHARARRQQKTHGENLIPIFDARTTD